MMHTRDNMQFSPDGWSVEHDDQSGGVYSKRIQALRLKLWALFREGNNTEMERASDLLEHPLLNCSWTSYQSSGRQDAADLPEQALLNWRHSLGHWDKFNARRGGGGPPPGLNEPDPRLITPPSTWVWTLTDPNDPQGGANPGENVPGSFVWAINPDDTTDATVGEGIEAFVAAWMANGRPAGYTWDEQFKGDKS